MQQGVDVSLLTTGETAQRLGISRHTPLRAVLTCPAASDDAAACRLRRKDGTIGEVAVSARRLRFAGRPAVLVFAQATDVRRQLQEAQRQAVQEDGLVRGREEFLAAAAHDLKTPLAS